MINITLQQFQSTREWTDSIANATGFAMTGNTRGFIYCRECGLFDVYPELHIFAPNGTNGMEYELEIGRDLFRSDSLQDLERKLYDHMSNLWSCN